MEVATYLLVSELCSALKQFLDLGMPFVPSFNESGESCS